MLCLAEDELRFSNTIQLSELIQTYSLQITKSLTQTEIEIIELLKNTCAKYSPNTTVRVAGGWVRDKIMNLQSHDMDFVVDNDETGVTIADKINIYINENENKHNTKIINFGIIKSNPSQSKHLETVTFVIKDVSIDINNLRSEVYSDQSRIPQTTKASALTDAFRRDFTINSLFYNINTAQIEDWTGLGLKDIINKKLRTPIDPAITMVEDPLRVLRAGRFAARMDFELDDVIQNICKTKNIHEHLIQKISRERIGIEIDKIISYNIDKISCIQKAMDILIGDWGLRTVIFALPSDLKLIHTIKSKTNVLNMYDCEFDKLCLLNMNSALINLSNSDLKKEKTKESISVFTIAAFLYEYYEWNIEIKKNKFESAINYIILMSLKFPNVFVAECNLIINGTYRFIEAVKHYDNNNPNVVELGHILCDTKHASELALILAYTIIYNHYSKDDKMLQNYYDMCKFMVEYKLRQCYTMKPLLCGSELVTFCEKYNIKRDKIGQLLLHCTNYQLTNFDITIDLMLKQLFKINSDENKNKKIVEPTKVNWSLNEFSTWFNAVSINNLITQK
jgi:tRNA nucleotidyltransferase (CCA-adding enzyme)